MATIFKRVLVYAKIRFYLVFGNIRLYDFPIKSFVCVHKIYMNV